jgi:hypothetical protein
VVSYHLIHGDRPIALAALLMSAAALAGSAGRGAASSGRLKIATSWPADERRRVESNFQSWIAADHSHLGHYRIQLDWLILEPDADLARLVRRSGPPDILLGGSAFSYASLAVTTELAVIDSTGATPLYLHVEGRGGVDRRDDWGRNVALADPRSDPIFLAWAARQLANGSFRSGYAALVRAASVHPRIGARFRPPMGRTSRGGQGLANAADETTIEPPLPECAAMVREAPNPEVARGFMRFLSETQRAAPDVGMRETDAARSPALSILADLLGATLVDAQDELWAARTALARAGEPVQALEWLTEPPPWPPASIAKYLREKGERAMSLVETLAGEVAPDPAARAWLVRTWLAPARTIDEELLQALAGAADGRLAGEPRFRSWLREEWIAWARQRYRRVARVVAAGATGKSK